MKLQRFHLSLFWEKLRNKSFYSCWSGGGVREKERERIQIFQKPCWENTHVQVEQSKCVYWCFIMHQLSQQTRQFPSWKTDNRCPAYEMFMMSASLDLPGAMRLTGWSQPISCSWLRFHYLRFYLRIYRTARWKWKNSMIPHSFFGPWLKLIIPLLPFFFMQICRLAPRPVPSGLMFAFGWVARREIRAVTQMLVENRATTLNDTIRQDA